MDLHFPGESAEYRAARDALKEREVEMRRAIEAVAAARRALPPGGVVPHDYVFEMAGPNGAPLPVKMSELFAPGINTLALYSYMFGPQREKPCNMCTPMLDGLNGVDEHVRQRVSFFVVAESSPARLQAYAKTRGWDRLQLLSAAGNTYNRDYFGKTEEGVEMTMFNVFHKTGHEIRHFWGSELNYGPSDPGQDHRGVDAFNPIFSMLDITPEGRGSWYPKLSY